MGSLLSLLIFIKCLLETVWCGLLFCTWLQCHGQLSSQARIWGLWQKPSWIILLMLAKQLASLNKPSLDCIYEMLCLPSNEPHYLNIKVEAHSIYPCQTIFLLAAGSTENNHMHSMETVMLRSSLSGNWRERVAPNEKTGVKLESNRIFISCIQKRGKV